MRIIPDYKTYGGTPCSFTSTGCAYEDIKGELFKKELPEGLRDDGYLTLDGMNKFIRSLFKVRKKAYYKRSERQSLEKFLDSNQSKCIVCVLGHFIYVNGKDYWSFFDNDTDDVVCVWYLN